MNGLTAEKIESVFARSGRLFGRRGVYSTVLVLWALLSQVLCWLESENAATEIVLKWQSRIHSLLANIQEILSSEKSYTDIPGMASLG